MSAHNYEDLRDHIGHRVEVVAYGLQGDVDPRNVAVECVDCCEVLMDFDHPDFEMRINDLLPSQ